MWYPAPPYSDSVTKPDKLDASHSGALGHSPQCRDTVNYGPHAHTALEMAPLGISQKLTAQPALCTSGPPLSEPCWSPLPSMPDPFVDDKKHQTQRKSAGYGTLEDQSMPDYSRSTSPNSTHHIANYSTSEDSNGGEPTPTTSEFDELMASFMPDEDGTFALPNTRMMKAEHTPPLHTPFSAPTERRALSYSHGQPRAVPVTTRDPPPPGSREPSDAGRSSVQSETLDPMEQPVGKVKRNPTLHIRSKKEGLLLARKRRGVGSGGSGETLEVERTGSQGKPIVISDGKRKRSETYIASALMSENENASSSPTRKVSRLDGAGDMPGLRNDAARAPFGLLNNIQ
jgi:hypothetical protein